MGKMKNKINKNIVKKNKFIIKKSSAKYIKIKCLKPTRTNNLINFSGINKSAQPYMQSINNFHKKLNFRTGICTKF